MDLEKLMVRYQGRSDRCVGVFLDLRLCFESRRVSTPNTREVPARYAGSGARCELGDGPADGAGLPVDVYDADHHGAAVACRRRGRCRGATAAE